MPEKKVLYEYNVQFLPEAKKGEVRTRLFGLMKGRDLIFSKLFKSPDHMADDASSTIITNVPMKEGPEGVDKLWDLKFYWEDDGPSDNDKDYQVKFTFVRKLSWDAFTNHVNGKDINYDSQVIISALNIILAKFPSANVTPEKRVVRFGDNRFFIIEKRVTRSLGDGLVAYRGFYSSVRPSFGKVLCNINVCTSAFFEAQNLARLIHEVRMDGSGFGGITRKHFDGLKVSYNYMGKTKKLVLKGLGRKSAKDEKFRWDKENGSMVSVEYYFKKREILAHPIPYQIIHYAPGSLHIWFYGLRKRKFCQQRS